MKYRYTYSGIWTAGGNSRKVLSNAEYHSEEEFLTDADQRGLYRTHNLTGVIRFKYRLSDNILVKMSVRTTGDYE